MRVDRAMLKENAKYWMSISQPRVWLVTLVFLLATTGVAELAGLAFPNPLDQFEALVREGLQSGDVLAVNTAANTVLDLLQTLRGRIGLFFGVLLGLYGIVMHYGYLSYCLETLRSRQPGYGELFSRFYMVGKIILAELLCSLFIFLWSLLFVIPGIIASYRYQMVPYLLLDDPDLPVLEAIRQSKEMMYGRKWELFVLQMSFLPWILGISVAVGVLSTVVLAVTVSGEAYYLVTLLLTSAGSLFLTPYQYLTISGWYLQLRGEGMQGNASENA